MQPTRSNRLVSSLSRRVFLKRAGLTTASFAASQVAFLARAATPNDTIQIGVIGTGGRARQLMRVLSKIDKVKITGVCDIYEAHRRAESFSREPWGRSGRCISPGTVISCLSQNVFPTSGLSRWTGKGSWGAPRSSVRFISASELAYWLDAIRTRRKPSAPAEAGVLAEAAALMANQAFREDRIARLKSE